MVALASDGICQAESDSQTKPEPAEIADEIVVFGKSNIINLRYEIYRAREDFLEVFNSLNTNEDFNFDCDTKIPVGRGSRVQVCKPKYLERYERWAGYSGMSRWHQNRIEEKAALMEEEMIALVHKHPELHRALRNFLEAQTAFATERQKRLDK